MFPNKPKEDLEEEEGPLKGWTFKPPLHIRTYILDRKKKAGVHKTTVILAMLDMAMRTVQELGDDFYEVKRRADVAEENVGVVIARLVREGLKRSK